MRKWFASLAVLGLSAVATAQTIPVPPVGGLGQSQSIFFDDAGAETSWKVSYPTGAGDAFSQDFDLLAGGMDVTGIALQTYQSSSGSPIGLKYVMLAPDSIVDSLGTTPDINAPLSILGSLSGTVTITGVPGPAAGYCTSLVGYDLPDVTVGSGGVHGVTTCLTGDSALWLCGDNSAPDNHAYFSINNYSTVGVKLTGWDLMIRVIGTVNTGTGSAYMTVNNATGTVDVTQTGFLSATLWSNCAIQPTLYIQGVTIPGYPFFQVPSFVLATGYENGSPIADSKQGTLGDFISDPSTGPCIPAGVSFDVQGFYLDNCDLNKIGHGKVKATNAVTVNITTDASCNPCVCFGQADDGSMDGTIWKVQNPAGSQDYFNVNIGTMIDPNTGGTCAVTNVLSVQAASWDFCGTGTSTGPSWTSVGLYEASTVDVGAPDFANVVATSTVLSMAVNSADFSYPATTYDFPDVATSTSTALSGLANGHVAMQWASGDTCTWIGSDTDGADDAGPLDTCTTIPNTSSYFTQDGFATPAIAFTGANWMMRVEWN